MEGRLARETEVLGENLPQRHFYPSQNPTWPDPGLNPGRRRGGKPATDRLSYGAAFLVWLVVVHRPVTGDPTEGEVMISSVKHGSAVVCSVNSKEAVLSKSKQHAVPYGCKVSLRTRKSYTS
jgi:hypothetical protein